MLDDQAVAGAERQAVDLSAVVLDLRSVLGACRRGRRIAYRFDRDVARGGDELIEIRRRDAQHLRDVVEAFARDIGGQQSARVDLQADQIADRARVLGPVQSMQRDFAGILAVDLRSRIETRLERRDELADVIRAGVRAAGRRHHATAQAAHDAFPFLRMRGDLGRCDALERQLAGALGVAMALGAVLIEDRPLLGEPLLRRFRATGRDQRQRRRPEQHHCVRCSHHVLSDRPTQPPPHSFIGVRDEQTRIASIPRVEILGDFFRNHVFHAATFERDRLDALANGLEHFKLHL